MEPIFVEPMRTVRVFMRSQIAIGDHHEAHRLRFYICGRAVGAARKCRHKACCRNDQVKDSAWRSPEATHPANSDRAAGEKIWLPVLPKSFPKIQESGPTVWNMGGKRQVTALVDRAASFRQADRQFSDRAGRVAHLLRWPFYFYVRVVGR